MDSADREAPEDMPGGPLTDAFLQRSLSLESLPIGVYVCDAEGVVTHYNRRAAEIWGAAPSPGTAATQFCGSMRVYWPDGRPMDVDTSPMNTALRTGETVRDGEVVIERPDGSRVEVIVNAEALRDTAGAMIGVVTCIVDVSGVVRDRPSRQGRAGWVQQVFQHSPVAIYSTDAEGRLQSFNQAAARLWGRSPTIGRDRWCGAHQLRHSDGRPMSLDASPMAQALKSGEATQGLEALFERPDGSLGAYMAHPTLLHDADGVLVGAVNMLVDISERKLAEDRQKVMVDELNHRVKNTLASVQSLAAHSLRGEAPPHEMRRRFEDRLLALSNAHNQLAERHWQDAELRTLVEDVLAPYRADHHVTLAGEPVTVRAAVAVTLCMVLHELATNALKYGALSTTEGRLDVVWRIEEGMRLVLEWREAGGPPVTPPSRQGFGTRFIEGSMANELGGRVAHAFEPAGVRCRVEAPI